jgi:prepilin-type N-terminal cleavage/methylation domain-containing protein
MRSRMRSRRAGFTLTEVLITLALFGSLIALTLGALSDQMRAFNNGSTQADAAQHLRFSMSVLEKHISNVGAGVPAEQPQLIYADTNVVAFNADWMSNIAGDAFAVNVDSTMPALWVTAVPKARQFKIPTTTFIYPDTTYLLAGSNSPAETVIFWFEPDASTPDDDYILWRQVNDRGPEMVARRLLRPSSGKFFRYWRHMTPASGSARLDTVRTDWLPMRHVVPIHGSNQDTAKLARIDSVRAIEVAFRVTDGLPAPHTRTFEMHRVINLPNAGKEVKQTCGDGPILTSAANFLAKDTTDAGGAHFALLRWNASPDDGGGEKDVVRYVLWRSTTPFAFGTFGDPYLSVAAGSGTYEYFDQSVLPLTTYYYAMAAQDCTPTLSSLRTSTVVIP